MSGFVNFNLKQIILFRGDGSMVAAPFSMFIPNAKNSPNFMYFDIIDHGTAIKLGEYDASTRSILYELDPEYREYCKSIIYELDPKYIEYCKSISTYNSNK